ncbi:hypothetical protein [Actinoplanes sp. NPDC026619]|uniref:hypothetical protein n=1 Tax=Actinoplanes sp. NPDC026619 TaxID=3155798 RepID=UPI0033DB9805
MMRTGLRLALGGLIIGPVLGPPLTGWLVDAASWRWILLNNVPLGLTAALLGARLLPYQRAAAIGVALVAAATTRLVPGVTGGGGVAAMLGYDPMLRAGRRPEMALAV